MAENKCCKKIAETFCETKKKEENKLFYLDLETIFQFAYFLEIKEREENVHSAFSLRDSFHTTFHINFYEDFGAHPLTRSFLKLELKLMK